MLPLDSYSLSPEGRNLLARAENVEAVKCMRQRNMDWPKLSKSPGVARPVNERRYGISNATVAATYGYQLPPPAGITRLEEYEWSLRSKKRLALVDRATMNAFTGESVDGPGCRDLARKRLHMDWVYAKDPVATAASEAWAQAADAESVHELDRKWSKCMRKSGHEQKDPLSAAGVWAGSGSPSGGEGPLGAPSVKEVAMASADVRCKASLNYIDRRRSIEAEFQAVLIKVRSVELQEYRSAWQHSLSAAQLIGSDAPNTPAVDSDLAGRGRCADGCSQR
ncbi:hypothetical protein [Streptomyces anulatus]|uniref:hypothetical protein n=1 Tax=Streptomyces anulatus TaxID=1892 RepID=UPI0012FED33E|nr:hypothetical protein [Streptomyces anulatus]